MRNSFRSFFSGWARSLLSLFFFFGSAFVANATYLDNPIITFPINGSQMTVQDSSEISLSGKAENESNVTVTDQNGRVICTTVALPGHVWSCTAVSDLPTGDYCFTVSSDYFGAVKSADVPVCVSVTVDCPPEQIQPIITAPYQDQNITIPCDSDVAYVTFAGTGTPGAIINAYKSSGTFLGTATVDTDGNWVLQSTHPFSASTYTVKIDSTLAGNKVDGANMVTFNVNIPQNCSPTHETPFVGQVVEFTLPCGQANMALTFSGTGTPGAKISLWDDVGDKVLSTTVDANGKWSGTTTKLFPAGHDSVSIQSTLGGVTKDGNSTSFIIKDSTNCSSGPSQALLGNFVWNDLNKNGIQDSGETGINGVTVELLNASGTVLATKITSSAVDSEGGNPAGLPGYYSFPGLSSGVPYIVRFVLPAGYTFTSRDSGSDGVNSDADIATGLTKSYVLGSGEKNLTVDAGLVQNETSAPKPVISPTGPLTLPCGQTGSSLHLTGTGVTGAAIALYDELGENVGTGTVDALGNWSLDTRKVFVLGTHFITVQSSQNGVYTNGNQISVEIRSNTNCGGGSTQANPTLNPVSSITLSCGQSTTAVTFAGTSTAGAIVNLKNTSGSIATTTVAPNGTWSITPSTAYGVGSQSVSVESTLSGKTLVGNTISFTVTASTNCGGGSISTTVVGPGGGGGGSYIASQAFTPMIIRPSLTPTPLYPQKPIIKTPVRKAKIAPYWVRFPEYKVNTPDTKKFLGTGPSLSAKGVKVVTHPRVDTSDMIKKKVTSGPLLAP